jgi:polysaccharide export outer membrane protein
MEDIVMKLVLWAAAILLTVGACGAQTPEPAVSRTEGQQSTYVLGPGDQVTVTVMDLDEIGKQPYRIDMRGDLDLPLTGRIAAAGLTAEQLESAIRQQLINYVKEPDVTVSLEEMRSQPVSVLGEVRNPGVIQLMGHKTLFELLSMAGGLNPDAGYSISITRQLQWGKIPLPDAHLDDSGQYWLAQVATKDVMDGTSPSTNILIMPNDVITVPKGAMVYVLGAVKKSGGFVLGENDKVTVLQALALAEGLDKYADTGGAKILRQTNQPDKRVEIAVNLKRIMDGKAADVSLQKEDILTIPVSGKKQVLGRTGEAAMQIGTGIAIWRPY